MTYRFLGSSFDDMQGLCLERFGETVDLSPEVAEGHILRNAALMPDTEFASHDFTADELAAHFSVSMHDSAPAEFLAKRNSAWKAIHEHREKLKAAQAAKGDQ